LRILFLTHRLPYAPNRGDRTRAYFLLRFLARHHEVHLVSLVHDDAEHRHLADLTSVVASARAARVPWLRNHLSAAAALVTNRPLTHALLASAAMNRAIREAVAVAPPDVVLAFCTGVACEVFKPPLDVVPCVLDMVDVDSEKWAALSTSSSAPMSWIYRHEARTMRAFEQQAMDRAVVTTVVSEREQALAERVLGRSATTVPVGVDLDRWRPPVDVVPGPDVVFCAVFNYEPNEDGAVWLASDVWPLVRRAVPGARLTLVGMHPTRRVQQLANDSIQVTGAVDDVRPFLWRSSAAVAPLFLARGTQTKVLEALAAGVPCVVTPPVLEGLPSAARGACTCRDDVAGFAEGIVSHLLNPRSPEQQWAIRQSVNGLGWDTQLSPFLHLLEEAAAEPAGS
jgi:sugar transferase (PEP-CTERM/EpsH1 system associated)